jgi:hypothetical protein
MNEAETDCEIPTAGGVGLGKDGSRSSSIADGDNDLVKDECEKEDSSKREGISGGSQDFAAKLTSQTTLSNSPPTPKDDEIKPILIQLPSSVPLGIDIDMVVPIVSYIQPYSPLRNHVSVGDIIIVVNGRSVMNLNHLELCSLLNGGSSRAKGNRDNGVNQREFTKLVLLPGKYRQKKKQQQRSWQTSKERQHHEKQETNKSTDASANGDDRFSSTASLTETTTPSTPPTDDCHSVDLGSVSRRTRKQQPPQREEEDTSCANSITPHSSSSSSSSKEIIVTNGDNIIFQQAHGYKHSNSDSSPITAVTSASLTTTSSSSSSSCSRSSIASNESSNVGNYDIGSHSYHDEILRANMTISFQKEVDDDVESTSRGSIPFLDYLEKKVREMNEKNRSASACVGNRTRSPQRNAITPPDPGLSPISSQSAAAAEAETIRRLRREVLGLYLTLDTLKRNSQEWMLLKSKLDVAREELHAVLEDQYLVRSISSGDSVAHASKLSSSEKKREELLATIPTLPLIGAETETKGQDDDAIDLATVDMLHHQQQQQEGTDSANDSAGKEGINEHEPTHSKDDEEEAVEEENNQKQETETVVKDCINENVAMTMAEQQEFRSVQDVNLDLDDRDRRQLERMNRGQPRIEFVTISNKSEFDSDISTLYGGIWNRELNCTAHRVDDNMMNCMEEGGADTNTYSRQQLMNRSVNTSSQAPTTTDKMQKHHMIIERSLLALIIMGAIGLVVFVVVFLIGD